MTLTSVVYTRPPTPLPIPAPTSVPVPAPTTGGKADGDDYLIPGLEDEASIAILVVGGIFVLLGLALLGKSLAGSSQSQGTQGSKAKTGGALEQVELADYPGEVVEGRQVVVALEASGLGAAPSTDDDENQTCMPAELAC